VRIRFVVDENGPGFAFDGKRHDLGLQRDLLIRLAARLLAPVSSTLAIANAWLGALEPT
jgi:hypothetical protein